MLLSEISDRPIVLADHMRKNNTWSIPKNFPKPSGYVGLPVKLISAGGVSYNINNFNNTERIIFSFIE